jgi:hypothetical protein
LLPNEELDGDTGAAFAVWVSDGIAISEINARAAMNFLMTHLLVMGPLSLFPATTAANRPYVAVIPKMGLWNESDQLGNRRDERLSE